MTKKIEDIYKICEKYLDKSDLKKIEKAFNFAENAHRGQLRKNQDPFIQHPLHAAETLAKLNLDADTISAALLHDTVEDADIKPEQIEKEFGADVKYLVLGVTRVGNVKLSKKIRDLDQDTRTKSQIENLRKMFIAMAKDIRVVLIKLADRLHNMQTLYALPAEKAEKIAQETLEIYAPLAHRLGIGEIKGELEDLAFPYVMPKEYRETKSLVQDEFNERSEYVEKMILKLQQILAKNNIKYVEINGRAKHLYSLYKKLQKYNNDVSKIYDLMAIRIILKNIEDCYKVLGIIHKNFKPLPGFIKDYISMPKPNGYQSLHTTIFGTEGKIIEIQIRTEKMHEHAEFGVAVHWHYTTKIGPKEEVEKRGVFAPKKELSWISELSRWQEKFEDPKDFKDALKLDFFSNRIFVFTPEGDVINLPADATPIDFAYAIHSDIGDSCQGAKVNGKIENLSYTLKNGEIVEIIKSKNAKPRPDWLKMVKTAEAKNKIRKFLKTHKNSNLEIGQNE